MSPNRSLHANSAELDTFSAAVAEAYFPHRLDVKHTRRAVPAQLRAVDLGPVRLTRIGWGCEAAVESHHPGAWAINIPRSGVLEARVAGRHVVSLDGQATLCPPDEPTQMTRWSADCSILGVRVDKAFLASELAALVGASTTQMPRQLDVRSGPGQAWLALVTSIGSEAFRNAALQPDGVVGRRLAATLSAALVSACFPHELGVGSVRPRIVKHVMDAMTADPARDWTASELATEAGVGIRRLQQGFRRYVGTTPTQALQEIRLERAHADLLSGRATTVAEAASRWGFTHMGRFAAAYRQRYGVSPSQMRR